MESLRSSRPIRMTIAAAALFLGLSSVVAHALEYRGVERFSKDFALDYSSAKAVLDGMDPYAPIQDLVGRYLDPPPEVLQSNILPGANWHTPFKVLVTLPLTALPFRAAGVVWLLICAAAVFLAGLLIGEELGWSRRTSALLGVGALAVPVVQIDLSAGNLNGPMLLLLVLAWRFFRRGRPMLGGAMIGALVALKFFPALLALPLLGRRRFREVGSAAGVAAALTVIGAALLGFDHAGSFLSAGRGDEGFDYWDSSPANISWWGLATRWLVPNGWVDAGFDLRWLGHALAVAGVAAALILLLKPRAHLSSEPFWAAVPLMLLAWPIVWIHYLVLAMPWVLLAGREILLRPSRRAEQTALVLVALAILIGFPPGTPALEDAGPLAVALLYQIPTAALIGAVLLETGVRSREGSRRPFQDPTPAR